VFNLAESLSADQKYKNLYTWDVTDAGQIDYLARELAA
jgi:hypothetical protein